MKRRLLLTLPAWLALGSSACSASPDGRNQPGYTVSAEQLQQAVAKRFPLRYPLGGLIDLNVLAPRLRLLPEVNRLGTDMIVEAAGPALRRSYAGAFDLDFALRYEASDRTVRAHQLRVNSLRFPTSLQGLPKCSMPTGLNWRSRLWAKWCCTPYARKTWRCPVPWACSRAASP